LLNRRVESVRGTQLDEAIQQEQRIELSLFYPTQYTWHASESGTARRAGERRNVPISTSAIDLAAGVRLGRAASTSIEGAVGVDSHSYERRQGVRSSLTATSIHVDGWVVIVDKHCYQRRTAHHRCWQSLLHR
jgi:hypothetical protein